MGITSAIAAGAFITDDQGRFLLVEEKNGKYNFPMGSVELDESLQEACAREVLEETGLTVSVGDLKRVLLVQRGDFTLVKFLFHATVQSAERAAVTDDEIVRDRYVTQGEFDSLLKDGLIRSQDMPEFFRDDGLVGHHVES